MTRAHQQSCPVAASLNQLGDMWTLLIVREALNGTTRFNDFQQNTGIAKNLLADRLTQMVSNTILEKRDIGERGVRYEYRLTDKGKALVPLMAAISQWGNTWVYGKGNEPMQLVIRKTGDVVAPLIPNDGDGRPFGWNEVALVLGPGADNATRARFSKRKQRKTDKHAPDIATRSDQNGE